MKTFAFILMICTFAPGVAFAQTGLPLPRYVSISAGEVNMRTGPGTRYPITWVYQKRGLPVEITNEFDTWRKIRDVTGDEGWVHQSMLSGSRHAIVQKTTHSLMNKPDDGAQVLATLEPGVTVSIEECLPEWCKVETAGYDGWLPKSALWGVYPQEVFE